MKEVEGPAPVLVAALNHGFDGLAGGISKTKMQIMIASSTSKPDKSTDELLR